MRPLALAICLLGTGLQLHAQDGPAHPLLAGVQRVYLLPMANGLDQFLANQLTSERVVEVVTDPKLADAVLTDAIGAGFEKTLDELLPAAPPEAPTEPDAEEEGAAERNEILQGATAPLRLGGFRRGRGNVFLVAVSSRSVVWSTFRQPKDTTPQQLNRTAARIARDLRDNIEGR